MESQQIPEHNTRVPSPEVPTLAPTCGSRRKVSSSSASFLEGALQLLRTQTERGPRELASLCPRFICEYLGSVLGRSQHSVLTILTLAAPCEVTGIFYPCSSANGPISWVLRTRASSGLWLGAAGKKLLPHEEACSFCRNFFSCLVKDSHTL